MKKYFLLIIALLCVVILLCSCTSEQGEATYSTTETSQEILQSDTVQAIEGTQAIAVPPTQITPVTDSAAPEKEPTAESDTESTANPSQTTTEPATQAPDTLPETTKKKLQKTGEMAFSDSADNKYLAAVVSKYGVNSKNLAAIYTVPDNNGNLVLEFDGTTDESGKLVRTSDTLIAIYTVDKELNCKRASEDSSLNEYPYGEMKVMFITTTKHIMPEFENELNG